MGCFLVGEITPVTEYQSSDEKARNRPMRPRLDEMTGLRLFRSTFADPSVEKDREKSVTVEFACAQQPVPPEAIEGATGMTAPGGLASRGRHGSTIGGDSAPVGKGASAGEVSGRSAA